MTLLNRIARINKDPGRTKTALRLINKGWAHDLGQRRTYAEIDPSQKGLWVRLHRAESQQNMLSPTMLEVAAQPIAASHEAGRGPLIIPDVTQERAIQERLQQARLAAVEQLAGGIAHHFSNILQVIVGSAEVALLDLNNRVFVEKYLKKIFDQGLEAAALIRQLLDFSAQVSTEMQVLDLAALVKECIKLLERTLPEDVCLSLSIEPASETYLLNADPGQIQQALTNLALNARDAMPMGGELRFHLSRLKLEFGEQVFYPEKPSGGDQSSFVDWLVLSVSDTGTGISPEVLPHIFEPFFTTKKIGQGAGLGLAQVYGIVKQHGGRIEVASPMGQGTSFSLFLPAWSLSPEAPPQPAQLEASCEYALLDYC